MTSQELRENFFKFMTMPPRNHQEIPNVSLVPVNDPTILFTNSGMFPLGPYLAGAEHPLGKRLCNFQRCLRTAPKDIEEIGDNRHTLMFEMMGNWSLGDYFKKEQIPWVLELYTQYFGLDPKRLYVSVWGGDELVGRDEEAIRLWQEAFKKYGIDAEFSPEITQIPQNLEEGNNFKYRIFPYGRSDNWWQRGEAPGELGGPCSEIFFDLGEIEREQDEYHINDDSGRFIEIGNSVFMEYVLDDQMNWAKLKQSNVDFGGGFERVLMCVQNKQDIFETDLYEPTIRKIEKLSNKSYKDNNKENEFTSNFRIIADHIKASTFIIADGIVPANKDQGYILRSLIRRMIRSALRLDIANDFAKELTESIINTYQLSYPHLKENQGKIIDEIEKEEARFRKTINKGLKELNKIIEQNEKIDGTRAFHIFETYGFPIEMIVEELKSAQDLTTEDIEKINQDFIAAKKQHQSQSKTGAEKKFKGGLADHSEETTALHTTHHLLLAALQDVLGEHVKQRGSNITAERLRIDFSHADKLSDEQINKVESIVNQAISDKLDVLKKTMPKSEAESLGAQMEFGQAYGDVVDVYFIQSDNEHIFSKEFCGGPHIANTDELSKYGRFKIFSEKSNGSGIRRIKAGFESL